MEYVNCCCMKQLTIFWSRAYVEELMEILLYHTDLFVLYNLSLMFLKVANLFGLLVIEICLKVPWALNYEKGKWQTDILISFSSHDVTYRNLTNHAIVAFRKVRCKSELSIPVVSYTRVYNGAPAHWNLIGRSMTPPPPYRVSYHPAVFFRHLRLTALSFPEINFWRAFQKFYCNFFVIN
jgi:hypothetical protein